MAAVLHTHGLHHAMSLGNIDVSSKSSIYAERCYESEDENMGRRRLRTSLSSELHPRTSIYSKGDIREQYCLTDRQLSTIERPRRERLFGCLSRRGAPQSFLGVCVGRRAPSDENLAAYAPFSRYPRYYPNLDKDLKLSDSNLEDCSYFRRQPASILSSSRVEDASYSNRHSWMDHTEAFLQDSNTSRMVENIQSYGCSAHSGLPPPPPPPGPSTPRTKHVSFARSHTLTSFDDVSMGLRLSGRIASARSQERLIGGKKTILQSGIFCESGAGHQQQSIFESPAGEQKQSHNSALHSHHVHAHLNQHHRHYVHAAHLPFTQQHSAQNQFPLYHHDTPSQQAVYNLDQSRLPTGSNDLANLGINGPPTTPGFTVGHTEIVVVEKVKRNTMKTQATQTEMRKETRPQFSSLSPRIAHKGAQTNGFPSNQKCPVDGLGTLVQKLNKTNEHEQVHRTQSEDPQRSPYQLNDANKKYSSQSLLSLPSNQQRKFIPKIITSNQEATLPIEINGNQYLKASLSSERSSYYENTNSRVLNYQSNSLPRHAYGYRCLENEICSQSLPRMELLHPEIKHYQRTEETNTMDNSLSSVRRLSAISFHENNESPFKRDEARRRSMPISMKKTEKRPLLIHPMAISQNTLQDNIEDQSGYHSTEEKEIFIDFKPHVSPTPSLTKQQRRKKLHKPQPDGLFASQYQHQGFLQESSPPLSSAPWTSEKATDESHIENKEDPLYENMPVKGTDSSETANNNTKIPVEEIQRRCFRERSSSLEDTTNNQKARVLKSAPPSPSQDDLQHLNTSTYPSSDSLANDLTRDHSDGIWNESQVTVVTAEPLPVSETLTSLSLLTPSSRRKSLILQHQQRSSIDTDFLDLEEQFPDQNSNLLVTNLTTPQYVSTTTTTTAFPKRTSPPTIVVPTATNIQAPTFAITSHDFLSVFNPTTFPAENPSKELYDDTKVSIIPQVSKKSSVGTTPKNSDYVNLESLEKMPGNNKNAKMRKDSGTKIYVNNTDISECSTNTDEYITCTDTLRQTPGAKTPPTTTSSSSTTQVPVSAQSSQTERTHDGSSFESASSLYSGRGDGFLDDLQGQNEHSEMAETIVVSTEKRKISSLTNTPAFYSPTESVRYLMKASPSHSIASTSSESYKPIELLSVSNSDMNKPQNSQILSPLQTSPSKMEISSSISGTIKKPSESISDDEDASEMRYSSSGYYESPLDDEAKVTRSRRFNKIEEDRKKRKANMKLDIENENLRALTSPIKRVTESVGSSAFDGRTNDQTQINIVDGTSPNKMKRVRPKIRRQFRRSSRDEPQKLKNGYALGISSRNTERLLQHALREDGGCGDSGNLQVEKNFENPSSSLSPQKAKISIASMTDDHHQQQQTKAKSVESLRSVSPGSDSVFYSENDGTRIDQQVQCLHCGKEVDSTSQTAIISHWGSQESFPCINKDDEPNPPDIVKPPADFADSPLTTKTSHRLYKKMEKRFRSEERHYGDRGRHYKTRQENMRAKSEERGKEKNENSPPALRPAGSSPCVLPEHKGDQKSQIIYWGHYDNNRYMRLTDFDVWMQLNHQTFYRQRERMPSTESEKSFHSKYQVILHRLVQRRCTLEMYHRQKHNLFKVDKTVVVNSNSGEFGFRIHGSKPVVVAAIEPETPAESSGLEVGDIIVAVNGVKVLDKHHTEVVKIAHAGCETLKLEVARTIGVLLAERQETSSPVLLNGYLWRQSKSQFKGSPNSSKWVRRWFCLRVDHSLYYYKTEKDIQPVGAIVLAKHTIEQCHDVSVDKPFAFKIDCSESKTVILAADTDEIACRWTTMLKRSAALPDTWLEKASRNLQFPANCIERPDCFGYLLKLGSRWCGWSRRYCVLKDACLYFYQDKSSKKAFGMVCLHGYKVASMSSNASGKKNSFEIIPPPESKLRHFYFSTESEMDKKRWISALEYSIDRWIKSG